MSANRSVQAAQRRRAGPTSDAMPGRAGPQPSINSAQVFSNQARSGPGPNIPNGRLAGQQAAMHQKQMQQQNQNSMQQKPDGVGGVSKMTIAQAITLITLRLGAIETKIIQIEHEPQLSGHGLSVEGLSVEGQDNMVLIDKTVIQSITSRLESLEKRSSGPVSNSNSGPEVALLKQNFEMVKQAIVQTKGVVTTISKENKELKTQVDSLKNDLTETKELLAALQNLTMDNSQKLLDYSVNMGQAFDHDRLGDGLQDGSQDGLQDGLEYEYDASLNQSSFNDFQDEIDPDEIIGTNLKELIENEINAV